MDAKLRAYLKRSGISDEALDKIARGEVPDDDTLRKGADNPTLEKFRQVNDIFAKSRSRLRRHRKGRRGPSLVRPRLGAFQAERPQRHYPAERSFTMKFTMRPIVENGVRKFTLGNGLVFACRCQLPPERSSPHAGTFACAHIERGDNVSGAFKVMTREAIEHLWPSHHGEGRPRQAPRTAA